MEYRGLPVSSCVFRLQALRKHGPCCEHRATFQPLRGLIEKGVSPHPYDSFPTSSAQSTITASSDKRTESAKTAAVARSSHAEAADNPLTPTPLKTRSRAAQEDAQPSAAADTRHHKGLRKTIMKKKRPGKPTPSTALRKQRVARTASVRRGQQTGNTGIVDRTHSSLDSRTPEMTWSRTQRRTNDSTNGGLAPGEEITRARPDTRKRRAESTKASKPKQRKTLSRAGLGDASKSTHTQAELQDASSEKFAESRRNAVVHSQQSRERLVEELRGKLLEPASSAGGSSTTRSKRRNAIVSATAKKNVAAAIRAVKSGAAARRRQ